MEAEVRSSFLIVEDEPLLGRALTRLVRDRADGVLATTIGGALEVLDGRRWTGLVIDVGLPDGSGLDLLRQIRERGQQVPALIVTGRYDPAVANAAFELRSGCVFKPDITQPVTLFVDRAIATQGEILLRTSAAVRELSTANGFTSREADVVGLLALGVSRERLAAELGVTENTVKTLARRILNKCGETRLEGVARSVLEAALQHAIDGSTT